MVPVSEIGVRRLFALWCSECDFKTGEAEAFAEHLTESHRVDLRRAVTLTRAAESIAIARVNAELQEQTSLS